MLFDTTQHPFPAKFFSLPPKQVSQGERKYLHSSEVNALIHTAKKVVTDPTTRQFVGQAAQAAQAAQKAFYRGRVAMDTD